MLTVAYIIAGVVGLLILWRLALAVWTRTADVYHHVKFLEWERAGRELEHAIRERFLREPTQVSPDHATGSYPLLRDPTSGRVLDADRGLVYDGEGLLSWSPEVHQWSARRRIVQSLHVNISGGDPAGFLAEPQRDVVWPKVVDLRAQFADREPSLNDLVVGVYPDESGVLQKLSASIHDLMHVLAVGASGWGKSSWLRSLLWQLARAREPVEVVAIDVSGSEFNALRGWSKLRYPVAREPQEAAALLQATSQEITRRKELYEAFPMATKLPEYNRLADEPLICWTVLVDEGTSLLNDGDIGDHLRRGVQQARQYGIYFVVSGQSANHRVIETQTRDQFSTRLCFRTSPTSSRVVLEDSGASNIKDKGRALAQLVGRELQEIQGPFITKEELAKVLTAGGPRFPMPEVSGNGGNGSQAARIKELAEQGYSKRQIALEIFGYAGGSAYQAVTDVLGGGTTTTT